MKKPVLPLVIVSALFLNSMNVLAASVHSTRHVLLISIDGMHQNDLEWFVKNHPDSTLARLVRNGIEYTTAVTPFPSDSFPGMVGQATGGKPRTTGIYYDDAYSRELLPPGTTSCSDAMPGAEVEYAENIDKDQNRLDAGQNIPGLYDHIPDSLSLISALSSHPAQDVIDPAQLPVDPNTCRPVYPHQYLKVNTVFEVAHSHGLHTAWADKHPAYEILSGPSGTGVDDFFTPEINGDIAIPIERAAGSGPDFTKDKRYDEIKIKAVLNWISGLDHGGAGNPGEPAIFGMSFQAVSSAQKLNTSHYYSPANSSNVSSGLGGYTFDTQKQLIPGPVLACALEFVDESIGKMVQRLDMNNTVVIISAKHGQSPENRADLTIIDGDTMIDALNTAWKSTTGSGVNLVAHAMNDDSVLLWLSDHSDKAAAFASRFLMSYSGDGTGYDSAGEEINKPFTHAGLQRIYAGKAAASLIGVSFTDERVPDVVGIAKQGSVYTRNPLKIAEHGGDSSEDRNVALVVAGMKIPHKKINDLVETTQIAPTILKLLQLNPNDLQAVMIEGTTVLPGL